MSKRCARHLHLMVGRRTRRYLMCREWMVRILLNVNWQVLLVVEWVVVQDSEWLVLGVGGQGVQVHVVAVVVLVDYHLTVMWGSVRVARRVLVDDVCWIA